MAGVGFINEWTQVSDLRRPHQARDVSSMRQIQLGILKATLAAYLLFILGFSALESLFSLASIALDVLALVGAFKNQRWTMIPVTLLAFLVIADSALPVYYSFKIGYYAHARAAQLVEELGSGLLLCLIAAHCCFVSYRYVGKPKAVAT